MDYTPKLSIVLTLEQYKKLRKLVPWGLKGHLFDEIVDQVIRLVETQGSLAIAQIISGEITLHKIKGGLTDVKHRRLKEEHNGNDLGGTSGAILNASPGKKNSNKVNLK